MRVLVAPNAFKGTLTATQAAHIIASTLTAHGHVADLAPMADGGDGTLDAFLAAGYQRRPVTVPDAAGRMHDSEVATDGATAVIELARICGMATVDDLPKRPWQASSRGLGLAAMHAIDHGATSIVLALGGSASVDGGVGFLQALGFEIADADGMPVSSDADGMAAAASIRGAAPDGIAWTVLADVTNPLLSPGGAQMFAAQKGIAPDETDRLQHAWTNWAALMQQATGVDTANMRHAGAAGGIAAAAHAVLGARLVSGAYEIAQLIDLPKRIDTADLVITGEGRFDEQSLHGKAPGVVIELAQAAGKPIALIAGQIEVQPDVAYAIATDDAPDEDPEAALTWAVEQSFGRLGVTVGAYLHRNGTLPRATPSAGGSSVVGSPYVLEVDDSTECDVDG